MAEKKNIGKSKKLMDFLWEWGAKIISYTDLALDKTGDFFEESWEEIMEIAKNRFCKEYFENYAKLSLKYIYPQNHLNFKILDCHENFQSFK